MTQDDDENLTSLPRISYYTHFNRHIATPLKTCSHVVLGYGVLLNFALMIVFKIIRTPGSAHSDAVIIAVRDII